MRLGIRLPKHPGFNSDFEYLVHDGYFLGSRNRHMDIYSQDSLVSFDCTSFVQYCAFGTESFDDDLPYTDPWYEESGKFKLITSDFIGVANNMQYENKREKVAMEVISREFKLEKLVHEDQLRPWDMIVIRGHMLIFYGYERNSDGSISFKTIEAIGGEYRSLDELAREIYGPQCDQLNWKRDQFFSEYDIDSYIVRIKG